MESLSVIALDKPTEAQIQEMTDLSVDAFTGDPLSDTLTGGIKDLKAEYYRLTFRAAALEGKIFVCQQPDTHKIVSVCAAFGPGSEFMGSEAQRALGFNRFFESLPEDTRMWWKEHLMNPNRRKDPRIKGWWKLWTVATLGSERRKGYGTLVVNKVLQLGEAGDIAVGTNAAPEINVAFYESLGFKAFDRTVDHSQFGTWVNTRMVWEASK